MNTRVITVASIEWPQAGKKMGAVIDSTGMRWGVWPDKLHGYQQFRSYEIGFKSSDFKGKTYYTIESAIPLGEGSKPSGLIMPDHPIPPPPPMPRQDDADDKRRMDIFVCGGFNNAMANPNTSPLVMNSENMIGLINNLKAAWKATLGPQAQPMQRKGALNADLDDEIPFR